MTAGSYCYIGPQGIVHGTTVRIFNKMLSKGELLYTVCLDFYIDVLTFILTFFAQLTVLNAGRLYLDINDLSGKVFVTSGLGGMSGAQAKVILD